MIRRRFLQLFAGSIVGTAAALHAPAWVLSSTPLGRECACAYVRRKYLDFTAKYGFSPATIELGSSLYAALESELTANARFVGSLPMRQQYEAWYPEQLLFKAAKVRRFGSGWYLGML